jgi:hypothetical protein
MPVFVTAGVAIGGAVLGGVVSNVGNKRTNSTNLDIAETPTRITSLDQLLNELSTTAEQAQNTSLDEFITAQEAINTNDASQRNSTNQQSTLNKVLENQRQQQAIQANIVEEQKAINESNIKAMAEQAVNTTGSTDGTKQAEVTRGDAVTQQALSQLTSQLSGGARDTSSAVQALMSQIIRDGNEEVNDSAAATGTFDSTTTELLRNDLNLKAAQAGAVMQLDEAARNDQMLLEAISKGQAGTEQSQELSREQQQILEAMKSSQSSQQSDIGSSTNSTNESRNIDGSTVTDSENVGSTVDQGNESVSATSRQNSASSQNTVASENMTGTSSENSTQNQVQASDQLQNPKDGVTAARGSGLAQLIAGRSATIPLIGDTDILSGVSGALPPLSEAGVGGIIPNPVEPGGGSGIPGGTGGVPGVSGGNDVSAGMPGFRIGGNVGNFGNTPAPIPLPPGVPFPFEDDELDLPVNTG